jgi:hypothetical protein
LKSELASVGDDPYTARLKVKTPHKLAMQRPRHFYDMADPRQSAATPTVIGCDNVKIGLITGVWEELGAVSLA